MVVGNNAMEFVFFVLGGLSLVAMTIWVIRALLRCNYRERIRAAWEAASQAASAWKGAEAEDDVARAVHEKVAQQKVHHFTRTCSFMCFAVGVCTLLTAVHIVNGAKVNMSPGQQVAHLVVQVLTVTVLLRPELVTWKTLDLFYATIALAFSAYVSPFTCSPAMMMQTISFFDFAMTCSVVCRRSLAVTVPLNLLYAVSSSATIWRHGAFCISRPVNIAIVHFLLVLLVPVAGFLLETAMRALLQQGIEMETAKELLGAACALLRSVCDVVVELDASGTIVSPVDDLGTFLLKGPGFALQSHRLADFLYSDEDKKMFQCKLHEDRPSGVGLAEALHARMKDGDRNLVRVEIFSFKFKHLDGHARFMVGLREFADSTPAGGNIHREPEVAQAAEERAELYELATRTALGGAQPAPEGGRADDPSEGGDSSSDQEPSGPSSTSCNTQALEDPTPAVMIVDTTGEGVPVCGLSAGFQMRVGRFAPDTCLLELVPERKVLDFARWLVAAARYGRHWPAARMTLNLRQGTIRATITVHQESDDVDVNPRRLQLLFSNIKITRGHGDGSCKPEKPYTDFRGTPGTPRESGLRMNL